MSDKDRERRDGQNKDKKNKRRRENINTRQQRASPRHQAKSESNLTDTESGPENRRRS